MKKRLQIVPTFPLGLEFVEVDVTRSIGDELSAQVVTEPVEGASVVTDEVLIDPRMLEIEAFFTDAAPLFAIPSKERAEAEIEKLRRILLAKAIVTLIEPAKSIANLVLFRVRVQRDRSTGLARSASLSFQQVKIIAFELVQAIGDADVEALGALGSVDLGLPPP